MSSYFFSSFSDPWVKTDKINSLYTHGKKPDVFFLKISVRLGMDNVSPVKLHCIVLHFSYICILDYFFLLNFLWKFPDLQLLGALLPLLLSNFDIYSSIIKCIYACANTLYKDLCSSFLFFPFFFQRAWLLLYQSQKS